MAVASTVGIKLICILYVYMFALNPCAHTQIVTIGTRGCIIYEHRHTHMLGFRRRTMQDPKIQSDTGLLLKGRNYVKLHLFTGKLSQKHDRKRQSEGKQLSPITIPHMKSWLSETRHHPH